MDMQDEKTELSYRLAKLFLFNLWQKGVVTDSEAAAIREHLIDALEPPIGLLERGQSWQIEL